MEYSFENPYSISPREEEVAIQTSLNRSHFKTAKLGRKHWKTCTTCCQPALTIHKTLELHQELKVSSSVSTRIFARGKRTNNAKLLLEL